MNKVVWEERNGEMVPLVDGCSVVWAPQKGSQAAFLTCPVQEAIMEGNRGGGKTDALLMDFGQHVGRGFGGEWRGILFRHSYKQLADVVDKSKKWFPRIWPSATFNSSDMYWGWPTGERLFFRYMEREADYWNYHGHSYPWIAFEEMTTWADDRCYRKMMSCLRSTHPTIPKKLRGTTNPYGPGHNWVKKRFQLPVPPGRIIGRLVKEEGLHDRIAIHSSLSENRVLTTADPGYIERIASAARNEAEKKAWIDGDWDIVAGGMFDDVWSPQHHVVPLFRVPGSWRLDRAFDWGSSKPFSVGWWAESDGTDLTFPDGRVFSTVRGDLFRLREWYGSTGEPNEGLHMLASEISQGIVKREMDWAIYGHVRAGPADSSIFSVENGMSIAGDMAKPVRVGGEKCRGVQWTPADKRPGSRKTGWELMRTMLKASIPTGSPRERPGLFVCDCCYDFIRTVPVLPRDLKKDPDDVDTQAEDHIADETRYRVRSSTQRVRRRRAVGVPG